MTKNLRNEIVDTMVDLNNLFVVNQNPHFDSVEVPIDVLRFRKLQLKLFLIFSDFFPLFYTFCLVLLML